MSKELLNCPFCGGEANCNNMGLVDHGNRPLWWVVCLECKVSTHGDVTKEAAIAAWNRREEKKAVTCNYERIIDMSADEMVEFLGKEVFGEGVCKVVCGNPKNCMDRICNLEIYAWLNEEANHDNKYY